MSRIIDAWRRVTDPDDPGPEAVVLVGMSGAGKTRLVQEFYRWLADPENGFNNGYWPPELGRTHKSLDIYPAFPASHAIRSGSGLPYLWYGIRFDNPDEPGTQPHPLLAAQDHIEPHIRYVRFLSEMRRLGWDAVKEDVSQIGWLVGQGLLESIPGGGLISRGKDIAEIATSVLGKVREAREAKLEAEIGQKAFRDDTLRAYADGLLDELVALAGHRKDTPIPIVFVVDDAQWASAEGPDGPRFADVVEFFHALMSRAREERLAVLVLATHWLTDWKLAWTDLAHGSEPPSSDVGENAWASEFAALLHEAGEPTWSEYGATIR
jgi:hypothetical protein